MADPKTWIDVADTAVTIGLAALVGGGFSVMLSKINHERAVRKEYYKRRREIIEKVLEDFDRFAAAQSTHWAKLANAVYAHETAAPDGKQLADEVAKTEALLWDSYRLLLPCQSRLALLGEAACVKVLQEFRDTSDAFFKIAVVGNPKCTSPALQEHKTQMTGARTAFYQSLCTAHSKST